MSRGRGRCRFDTATPGSCRFGANCRFSHGPSPTSSNHRSSTPSNRGRRGGHVQQSIYRPVQPASMSPADLTELAGGGSSDPLAGSFGGGVNVGLLHAALSPDSMFDFGGSLNMYKFLGALLASSKVEGSWVRFLPFFPVASFPLLLTASFQLEVPRRRDQHPLQAREHVQSGSRSSRRNRQHAILDEGGQLEGQVVLPARVHDARLRTSVSSQSSHEQH